MFKKDFLAGIRLRAIRKGVWYRALDRLERGILTLASRIIDEVSDSTLGVLLLKIIAKIRDANASRFVRHVETFGVSRANVIITQAWVLSGQVWSTNVDFARYFAFIDYNQPIGWGSRGAAG